MLHRYQDSYNCSGTLGVVCVGSGFPFFLLFFYVYLSYIVCSTHVFSCICTHCTKTHNAVQIVHSRVAVYLWIRDYAACISTNLCVSLFSSHYRACECD